jgi:hypothetical protein
MQGNMDQAISYPTIVLGGQEIPIKFRLGDVIRLKKNYSIDVEKLDFGSTLAEFADKVSVLLSAAVAHQVSYSPEQISDMVDMGDMLDLSRKMGEAIKKAIPQVKEAEPLKLQ